MRALDKLILHCSDSNIKAHDDIKVINQWHKERGFKCILDNGDTIHVGYHFFIKSDGTIQEGRPLDKQGAHCYGQNKNSVGICLHGREKEDFTVEQFTALATLIRELWSEYPGLTIHGHNEFADKACPVYDIDDFMETYLSI